MSYWTYVTGVIKLDTMGRSTPEAMYLAQTVVRHLPRVSGSTGSLEFHFNQSRHSSSSADVDEFDRHSNLYDDAYYGLFESQPEVILTVDGALQDRLFHETLRDVAAMLKRLASRLSVSHCLLSVSGLEKDGKRHHCVIDDPDWLSRIELTDWAPRLVWAWPGENRETEEPEHGT